MKTMFIIAISMIVATSSFALIDTSDNSVGLYFDVNADVFCVDGIAPYNQVMMHLILTNPTFENLSGWECGVDLVGNALVLNLHFYTGGIVSELLDNMIVGYGTPYPTTVTTPMVDIEILYLGLNQEPVEFFIHGSAPSSIDPEFPTLLTSEGELIMAGISVNEGPAAQINGSCSVVSSETLSIDSIKGLYRN